jgi:hypothetical protein
VPSLQQNANYRIIINNNNNNNDNDNNNGARGSVVVKALGYKPEGRRFENRRDEILNLPNLSGRTKPWDLLSL